MKFHASMLTALAMLAAWAAGAGENLLRNSDFSAPGVEAPRTVPGWSATGGASLRVVDGKLELATSTAEPNIRVEQFRPAAADWGTLRFSGKLEILKLAAVGNTNYRVYPSVMFFSADKKILGTVHIAPEAARSVGAHEFSEVVTLPAGTVQIALQFRINSADAVVRVSDLMLERLAAPGEAFDAPAPLGRTVDWGREPVIALGSDRAEIVLSGLWQLQPIDPALNKANPAARGWGLVNVPGIWNVNSKVPGIAAKGGGPLWNGKVADASAAWLRRRIAIPADWKGRTVELEFERVGTVADIRVNGIPCGRVQHPTGKVDITKAVKAGEEAELLVQVLAVSDVKEVLVIEGATADQFYMKKVSLEGKGLTGDVILSSRPASGGFAGVFIQPSVRQKELTLAIEFAGLRKPGDWTVAARALEPDGKVARTFPPRTVRLTPDGAGEAVATLKYPWENPKLWDLDQPNLYDLELTVTGEGRTETIRERFGFREFHIAGRDFFLNGKKFNLRPVVLSDWSSPVFTIEGMRGAIDGWKKAGFNLHEVWPQEDFPGKLVYPERAALDYAAEIGWPVIADLPSVRSQRLTFTRDREGAARWRAQTVEKLRKFRNNPAILMWVHSVNTFNGVSDQDPRYIGQTKKFFADANGVTNALPTGFAVSEELRKLDPTRPNFSHAGQIGDLYTTNNYLSMIPLQEQEEWLSDYIVHGEMPYLAVEFGFIPGFDFRRGRSAYRFTNSTEKQMTEHLAAFYGRDAYRKESLQAATENRDTFLRDQLYRGSDTFIPDELALDLFARMNRQVYRSWRTAGNSGGMIPWMIKDGFDLGRVDRSLLKKTTATVKSPPFVPGRRGFYKPFLTLEERYCIAPEAATPNAIAKALMEVNSATLAWLGGAKIPGDPVDFTEKSHNFFSGETVEKQIVLHNDLRTAADYRYELKLVADGKTLAEKSGSGSLDAAGKLLLPVEFKLPEVNAKLDAELILTARIGDTPHRDRFTLRVFPARQMPAQRPIALFDPRGDTQKFLKGAGYNVKNVTDPADAKLLVIGREALGKEGKAPFDLEKFVTDGGTLLVMAHKGYGETFRYGHFVQRQVFPLDDASPITAGLDAEDLRDWRGTGTLLENYPARTPVHETEWGWHWGNRGSVASRNIEKPHHGGWTPLMEADFDLQYTPLTELARGKGGVILSQLDFEDNLADPAAMRLFDNLLNYAEAKKFAPRRDTVYLGNEKTAEELASFGLKFRSAAQLPADAGLVLAGPGAAVTRAELEAAVRRGAKVAVLGAEAATKILGLELEKRPGYRGSLTPPAWPEGAGLSASDLRWRSPFDAELLKAAPGLEIGADGQLGRLSVPGGHIIVSLLDPNRFNADVLTYWRFTRWRQTRALNQLLANLGGDFTTDDGFFRRGIAGAGGIGIAANWRGKLLVKMGKADKPLKDPGLSDAARAAIAPDFDDSNWMRFDQPFIWQRQALKDPAWDGQNGEAVFRREIILPPEYAGKPLKLTLGLLDDGDRTSFNGELIGQTDNYQAFRIYTVPGNLVKAGRNVLAIRLFDNYGEGGFFSPAKVFRIAPFGESPVGPYHADYLEADFKSADHPHRYHRW